MWLFVIVTYNTILIPNSKSKNRKRNKIKIKMEKEMEINKVHYLQTLSSLIR